MVCILPSEIENLKEEFRQEGGLKAFRSKNAKQRIDFFYNFLTKGMGDISSSSRDAFMKEAETYASRIEEKLLENQNKAVDKWASFVRKPTIKKDILEMVISNREIIVPNKESDYMDLLVRRKLGFSLNSEDAQELMKLADSANQSLQVLKALTNDLKDYNDLVNHSPERIDLGGKLIAFKDVFDKLKLEGKTRNIGAIAKAAYAVAGNLKSLKASFDASFGRQLSSAILAGEKGSIDAWRTGIRAFWNGLVDPQKNLELKALLMTRKNALNGNYAKFGIDIGIAEEAFPESFLLKIPALGRAFGASEQSFSLALQYARANIFDARFQMAVDDMGGNVEAANRLLQEGGLGKYINSITGRAETWLKGSEGERALNYMMFSPRWLASRMARIADLRFSTIGNLASKSQTDIKVMRGKAAIKQLIWSLAFGAGTRAFFDDDEEKWSDFINPISGGFLQGKIVDVKIDQTFGQSGLLTFAARLFTGKTLTQEGVVKKQQRFRTLGRWLRGKESPFVTNSISMGQYLGYVFGLVDEPPKTYMGDEYTPATLIKEGLPISLSNFLETEEGASFLQDLGIDSSASGGDTLGTVILDVFGISARKIGADTKKEGFSKLVVKEQGRTARAINKSSQSSQLSKQSSLMTKLSGSKRDKAQADFTRNLNRELEKFYRSSRYRNMKPDARRAEEAKIRTRVQNDLKKKNGIK